MFTDRNESKNTARPQLFITLLREESGLSSFKSLPDSNFDVVHAASRSPNNRYTDNIDKRLVNLCPNASICKFIN